VSEPVVIHVGGASPYDVVVGRGLTDRLVGMLGDKVERVALMYAAELSQQAEAVVDALVQQYEVLALGLPEGEDAKSASVANDCWEALGERASPAPTPS
jgi:3-dehydroquinate synthase